MLSKQILIDLCTQRDFLSPEGAVPVSELSTLIPNIRRVIVWAKRNRVSIISAAPFNSGILASGAHPNARYK